VDTVCNEIVQNQGHAWDGDNSRECGQTEGRLTKLVYRDHIRRLAAQERRRAANEWTVEDILRREG
jgi:hypothetical protein